MNIIEWSYPKNGWQWFMFMGHNKGYQQRKRDAIQTPLDVLGPPIRTQSAHHDWQTTHVSLESLHAEQLKPIHFRCYRGKSWESCFRFLEVVDINIDDDMSKCRMKLNSGCLWITDHSTPNHQLGDLNHVCCQNMLLSFWYKKSAACLGTRSLWIATKLYSIGVSVKHPVCLILVHWGG